MSGFGQNPAGSSAFSFPSLNQPNTTAPGAAPPFSFGTQKTAGSTAPLGATPTFGASPSLGVKTGISLTTSTPSGMPTLGAQQPGTLFGSSWSGGMFSAGSNAPANTSAAALPPLAPAATSTATTGQFSFGAPTATPATQGQTLFGSTAVSSTSGTPGFSMPTTSLPPATMQAPPTAPPATAAASNPTLNFNFGSAAPNTTAPPPASLGLSVPSFGAPAAPKPQAAPASTAPTLGSSTTFSASTPLASTTLKFSVASSTAPAPTPSTLAMPAKTATATVGMAMFSGPTTTAAVTSAPPPSAVSSAPASAPLATSLLSTPAAAPAKSVPVATTATTGGSVTTAAAAPPTAAPATSEEDVMTYSKLQENINKWAMELEKLEKIFLHQATEMNGWDRVIVENSDKLHMLNSKIEKVRKEQRHLDLELDYILSQQNELDHMLKGLEKEWGSVPPSDPERQHTYKIAESLDYKLKLMSEDLKEVVDHMNAMNYPPNDEFNPVMQIVRILNAHMNVLLMVERKTNLAECKVKEVSKLLELCKRDYDRACHLYFD
ncbi:nuclear pore glycoprotein p62-like isoform X2 [Ischnura elegans]|uniref:nuclear pore glycoprotein p62-like isoform X2 n=1 Tax=Ischnura elegans TaxID=197161 RepID=UPI001ED8BC15|nr:nuclear pore glycoprotein p62-like isoform X2 [Ischnura elegans]